MRNNLQDSFLPKPLLLKQPIPPSTDTVIIFPYAKNLKGFNRLFYSPILTDRRATYEDIDVTLRSVEAAIENYFAPMRTFAICSIICLSLIICPLAVLHYICNLDGNDYNIVFCFYWAMITIFIFVLVISVQSKLKTSRLVANRVLKIYNERYNQVGLSWHLPRAFPRWIELRKDYMEQNALPSDNISSSVSVPVRMNVRNEQQPDNSGYQEL